MANWEELPQHLLELIAGRLAIKDYLAFGGVCTSWRSAAATAKEAYKAKLKAPWLMIYKGDQSIQFFSPSRGRINREKVPGSKGGTLSTPGWILVSKCGNRCRIFNPLSNVSIKLPTLGKLHRKPLPDAKLHRLNTPWCYPHGITARVALSSSPSLSKSYTVMIYVRWQCGQRKFAFHRYGEDAWTVVSPSAHLPWSDVLQLICYDGLFLALDVNNRIMTLNEEERRMELRLVLRPNCAGCWYLVECSGSLLAARRIWGEGNGFQVFKVDLEKGTQEEVKSLGNASLFLNDDLSSSFSVQFTDESCLPRFKPNRIYFIEREKKKSYSMYDGKIRKNFRGTRSPDYATKWFQPDF